MQNSAVHACRSIFMHACMHAHRFACMQSVSACMQMVLHACRHACTDVCMHAACMQHACCMHALFRRDSVRTRYEIRFSMKIIGHNYFKHEWQQRAHFWRVEAFYDGLSKYLITSHNFTNSSFCDITLNHSIGDKTRLVLGLIHWCQGVVSFF